MNLMFRVKILVTASLVFWLNVVSANQLPPVSGVIALLSGEATIKTFSPNGKSTLRKAVVGQSIHLNDEIKTGEQSRLQLLLRDQSVFNIGASSSLVIDKFIFDEGKSQLGVNIERGAFKFVSGKIANSGPDAMKVKLPNTTIAVRGTRVAGEVAPNGGSTVVLLHGVVNVTSSTSGVNSSATLSKSGWGVQVGANGSLSTPTQVPADTIKGILQNSGASVTTSGASGANPISATNQSVNSSSNSGLTSAQLANSLDASRFVSAPVAQSFKENLLNNVNTQAALNGSPDMISADVINQAINNNPAVWAGILQAFGMPADTPLPDSQKQSTLAQFVNSDFAKFYALLVFPKIYSPGELQSAAMGPLGTVTFNAANIPMACSTVGACGANASALINQTVTLNYTAAQMTNTFNVSYSNFHGLTGSASGTASAAFSALQVPGGGGPAPQLNVILPGSPASGSGGTTVNMVGQFGSIGDLVGKWSGLTTSLSSGGNSAHMRAGYQVKGQ